MTRSADDIWTLAGEEFDEKLPRRTAILLKPSDDALHYAYPARWGTPGYCFDMRDRSTYEEHPAFRAELCPYSYPGLLGAAHASPMSHYYARQVYYPSLVEKELVFSTMGLEARETFARPIEGGFSWRFRFESKTVRYDVDKTLYFVVTGDSDYDKTSINRKDNIFTLSIGDKRLVLKTDAVDWGMYETVDQYMAAIQKGRLARCRRGTRYLVLGCRIRLAPDESTTFTMGISLGDEAVAQKCHCVRDLRGPVQRRWNKWFRSLPSLPFGSERERKAYYKCWWIVKLNYYQHPEWGHGVLEAFPVYRGYWLWGLTASEWHSSQNTEHQSKFIRMVLDLFIKYQRDDGFITHAIYLHEKNPGEVWASRSITQTPHIPWVALRYFHVTRDKASLARWYQGLARFYDYMNRSRDPEHLHLWAATTSYDTGLDTNPVLDKVTFKEKNGKKGEEYCYIAMFGAERFRYELALARIAAIIDDDRAEQWEAESRKTRLALVRYLWDADRKWYGVRHENGRLDTRVSIDGLVPFSYGIAPREHARRAKQNFKKLIGTYGVHNFAPGEKGFCEDTYWRGPSWAKSCSCAMEAARVYYPALLSTVTDALVNFLLAHPSVWECLNARTGKVARGDMGFMATPVICSNVGSGEAMAALFSAHGIGAFSMDDELPLVPVTNFHWAGFRLDIEKRGSKHVVSVRKAELAAGVLMIKDGRRKIALPVRAGQSYEL